MKRFILCILVCAVLVCSAGCAAIEYSLNSPVRPYTASILLAIKLTCHYADTSLGEGIIQATPAPPIFLPAPFAANYAGFSAVDVCQETYAGMDFLAATFQGVYLSVSVPFP